MAKKITKNNKEKTVPAVQTAERAIHFSPRFIGLLADEVAKTVVRRLPPFRRSNGKRKKSNTRTTLETDLSRCSSWIKYPYVIRTERQYAFFCNSNF